MTVLAIVALGTSIGGSLVAHMQYDWLASQAHTLEATRMGGRNNASAGTAPDASSPRSRTVEFGSFYELENMIVNPAESGGGRYLMVNVGFESDDEDVITELENKEVVVRDKVIKMLGEFTAPILADIDRRSFIKDTLRQSVNQVLKEGQVTRLYFTQYVLQ